MGHALAEALLARGHVTTVWNRSREKADGLVSRGARLAESAAAAVAASTVSLVCLKDYATMYRVLDSLSGAPDGRALVHLSSGTPGEARAAADWAAERGYGYVDGAVMVPPAAVGQPDAVLLYSGPADVFDRHRETLTVLGTPRYLGTDPGLAVLHNAALLDLMYASLNGFLHAAALVGTVDGLLSDRR
ncbi:tartronate semialdehyde reductase [Streptomyces sp. MP131-18]|nr:tartronate semialdehyde reductase [Streptomyces sp. MP131-18]